MHPESTTLPQTLQLLDEKQRETFDRLINLNDNIFVLWWKMGTGKTRMALAAFWESQYTELIVITRRIAFGDWIDEVEKCGFKFRIFQNDFQWSNLVKLHATAKKTILLLSAGDLKNRPDNYPKGQMMVVDELYLFSNPKSKRSRMLQQMSIFCGFRMGLSGTIMPARNNMAIFGQMLALNANHPLAKNTTEFQTRFQTKAKGRFCIEYVNKPGADDEITKILAPRVDIYFPVGRPTRTQIVKVDKTPEQNRAVKKLKELYEWDNRTYDYALQVVHAVNGISNGWWIDSDSILSSYKSTKIDRLFALLDDIVASGESVVVWCAYHNDISRISEELKHPWIEFTARVPFHLEKWKEGKTKIVLATEAMGTSVNHFKHTKYAIYFSINYKLLDLEQSKGRHERKGSAHDGAHYYFLQTRGTIDARTYQLVTESKMSEEDLIQTLNREIFQIENQ